MIRSEETVKFFVDAALAVVSVSVALKDNFLRSKLRVCLNALFFDYLRIWTTGEKKQPASSLLIEKIIADINSLTELLETLEYFKAFNHDSPLLLSGVKKTLVLKLAILRLRANESDDLKKAPSLPGREDSVKAADLSKISDRKMDEDSKEFRMNKNKEKILNFIKNFPDKRAKDIIYEFNAFSDRTVKRTLTELLRVGLIQKKIGNRAAYYSAVNIAPK